MVRLEQVEACIQEGNIFDFNSIMVRLEQPLTKPAPTITTLFQFHYGAIGTV